MHCADHAGSVGLPVVAAIKGSEPHMPISLVSISPADSTLTVASHDGCLKQYRYAPATHAAGASTTPAASASGARASGSAPDHVRARFSTDNQHIEQGCNSSHAESGEMRHESQSSHSSHSTEEPHSGNDGLPVNSVITLTAGDSCGDTCNGHLQRTDHDREGGASQTPWPAEHRNSQQADRVVGPLGEGRGWGGDSTALGGLNVEAVSALTVIESQLLYSPDGGQLDHLISGFQVSSPTAPLRNGCQHCGLVAQLETNSVSLTTCAGHSVRLQFL